MTNSNSIPITIDSVPAYLRIRITPEYNQQPIISRLVSDYQLVINITAALLTSSARDDGWFDLEVLGDVVQINQALADLHNIGIEVLLISPPVISEPPPVSDNVSVVKEWRQFDIDRQSSKTVNSPDQNLSDNHQLDSQSNSQLNSQLQSQKIQIRIPKECRDIPVINTLIIEHGLTVNIARAIMPFAVHEDGWFELELQGKPAELNAGLEYLKKLGSHE